MTLELEEVVKRLQEEKKPKETDPRVLDMVREQLRRDPPPPLGALYGRAVRIDPRIRQLDLREFNARYALRVRRQLKAEENGAGPQRAVHPDLKKRLRGLLLRYLGLVVAAETFSEILEVVQQADPYADAIAQLLSEAAPSAAAPSSAA